MPTVATSTSCPAATLGAPQTILRLSLQLRIHFGKAQSVSLWMLYTFKDAPTTMP
ncbi:MAG: hypothetical protein IPK61_17785 [Saprospiraceae bacterium]|nr:hypothetical protein [Saprospiraceae bacterium]